MGRLRDARMKIKITIKSYKMNYEFATLLFQTADQSLLPSRDGSKRKYIFT